jgi:signal transduction histidine kinase
VEVALGAGLLLLSVLLAFRALGLWFSDAFVWPLVLVTSGAALIWRRSPGDSRSGAPSGGSARAGAAAALAGGRGLVAGRAAAGTADRQAVGPTGQAAVGTAARADVGPTLRAAADTTARTTAGPAAPTGAPAGGTPRAAEALQSVPGRLGAALEELREALGGLAAQTADRRRTAASISRVGVGVALVIAAAFAFLQATGALSAARDVILSVLAVVVVLGVIFAPWILRLVRSLTSERAERIRSQERAEVAAHLHDSVLQTLAMVQRRASEPNEVAALARRQERELRAWLADRPAPGQVARLAPALEAAAAEVEERHGVAVEVVAVGDRDLDPATLAVVGAAREAMTNAAKFGGGSTVDVYAECAEGRLQVFVRDRGPGFDPAAIPADRRGVRESIVGRMERHGGRATITSAPGAGTEVELLLADRA